MGLNSRVLTFYGILHKHESSRRAMVNIHPEIQNKMASLNPRNSAAPPKTYVNINLTIVKYKYGLLKMAILG